MRDALKEHHSSNLLAKVRKISTAARTPKRDAILKRRAGKGAIMDQATQWGSTYNMVKRIVKLRPVLTDMENPDVTLTELQWKKVEELEDLLRLSFKVTKKLQEEYLTPGMFLKEWKMYLEHFLTKKAGLPAETLRASMKQREVQLLNNKILLAGVYVDPMNRVLLTEIQKNEAKSALCDLAVRILGLNRKTSFDNPDTNSITESEETCDKEDFEKFLDQQDHKARSKRRKLEEAAKVPASDEKHVESF